MLGCKVAFPVTATWRPMTVRLKLHQLPVVEKARLFARGVLSLQGVNLAKESPFSDSKIHPTPLLAVQLPRPARTVATTARRKHPDTAC